VQLGLEEALVAHGVECRTFTTQSLPVARALSRGLRFDQVWIDVVQSNVGEAVFRDGRLLERLAEMAPVRLGLIFESLDYTPDEVRVVPHLERRRRLVEERLPYLTHVVTSDEKDAERIAADGRVRAIWWPQAVPGRLFHEVGPAPDAPAVFSGGVYGERSAWLASPALEGVLRHLPSPEAGTADPLKFDMLHAAIRLYLTARLPGADRIHHHYLRALRVLRRRSYERWILGLRAGCAVVNLPHFVKGYAGRVVEGMASGRPVISWEVPGRPRNRALFEDGREILLFPGDSPAGLVDRVRRIRGDHVFATRLAAAGQKNVREFHTLEMRVRQVLDWVERGTEPFYG
jgi:hypothetical protein